MDKRGQQCLFFPSNHNNEALCPGRAGTFYANNPVCATSKNSSTMDDGHGLFKKSSQIARLTHVPLIFLKTLSLLRQLFVSYIINHIINWKRVYKNNFKTDSKIKFEGMIRMKGFCFVGVVSSLLSELLNQHCQLLRDIILLGRKAFEKVSFFGFGSVGRA